MSFGFQGLIKPKKLDVDKKTLTESYGKFVAEPFEKGFATTIGNALRRHLISSIEGAAITSVKFDNVFHEFSTVPGVIEDMANIILNLKTLRLKMLTDDPQTIHLNFQGEGEIKAKDIVTNPNVEVVNPECHIATLDKNGKLNAEMIVQKGRGYVPSEKHLFSNDDTQMIAIDSIFSPIQKVNYKIENTRVGASKNFEKLVLEVWTDGSINPEDAVAHSAKLLKDHLQIFINFEEEEEVKLVVVDEEREKILNNLRKNVDELELSVRSFNCLKNANIKSIVDLVVRTDGDMLKTQNFGRKSLNEIKEILKVMSLTLGMNIDEYKEELSTRDNPDVSEEII